MLNPTKIKICGSSYLNSAPLVYAFEQEMFKDSYEFFSIPQPSRCSKMLSNLEVEIALIPIIEVQRLTDIKLIPNITVSSFNSVRSVLLFSKVKIEDVDSVLLDSASRTSQTLIKIIFSKFLNKTPSYQEINLNLNQINLKEDLGSSDAILCIADPALKAVTQANNLGYYTYDLAELWNRFTGLPFTFAVWGVSGEKLKNLQNAAVQNISGQNITVQKIIEDFSKAKSIGQTKIEEIVDGYLNRFELSRAELVTYLTKQICYDLTPLHYEGISEYFALAHQLGLIEQNKKLEFL